MRVAVVIPLYQQAQFLVEAVVSALAQSFEDTGVVIINDGCPDPLSHELGTAFATSHPSRVAYIRQRNGGLSAARNRGVRYALGRWPELEAFFFLDSDNLLLPGTIEAMYARLNSTHGVDWVYSTLELFGAESTTWRGETPANLFRMLFENQADAGSLIGREIFEKGIYFDETMRQGYEDWEFFIRVLRNGYRGERAPDGEMLYRVKHQSMLTESRTKHNEIVASIHKRHADILEPRRLTAIEHEHSPRFLWVHPNGNIISTFTDPDAPSSLVSSTGHADNDYWPPLLVVASAEACQLLDNWGMLRGVLLLTQAATPKCPVAFRIEVGGQSSELVSEGRREAPHLLCFYSWRFKMPAGSPGVIDQNAASRLLQERSQSAIRIPRASLQLPVPALTVDAVFSALVSVQQNGVFDTLEEVQVNGGRQSPRRYFAWDQHCVKLDTTYPLMGDEKLRIGFAVPWLKLGGVDQCVVQLARAIRRLVPGATLHLVATTEGVQHAPEKSQPFDEVILLGIMDGEKRSRLCNVVFRSMDLVINAHSEAAYRSLKWRLKRPKDDRTGMHVSYLHVIDEARGRQVGYPIIAANLAHGLDGFAVISDNLRNFLINEGVAPSRIRIARNAPVVRPACSGDAFEMAAAKAQRLASGERPLRLLFAGRADYQKGITRLKSMAELLVARGAAFELRFVGDAHLRAEEVEWPAGPIFTHPATHDEAQLASYYAEADVCVLLSRWEGVPLSLLDAMAHGCVVVATDVGGVSELVDDRKSGFLLANGRDEEVAAQAADVIEGILQDDTGSAAMRQQAVATAWRYSWDEAAKVFLSFLPDAVKARHGLSEL